MAVLSADAAGFAVDGEVNHLILPLRAAAADTFYRGGVCQDSATGIIASAGAQANNFRGFVAERTVTTAANDRVRAYIFGHFLFDNANFTIANEGQLMLQLLADGDNPAGIIETAAGATMSGEVGAVTTSEVSGTSGWILAGVGCSPRRS